MKIDANVLSTEAKEIINCFIIGGFVPKEAVDVIAFDNTTAINAAKKIQNSFKDALRPLMSLPEDILRKEFLSLFSCLYDAKVDYFKIDKILDLYSINRDKFFNACKNVSFDDENRHSYTLTDVFIEYFPDEDMCDDEMELYNEIAKYIEFMNDCDKSFINITNKLKNSKY